MRFQCSNCFSVVSIDDSEAGQAVACGQCDNVVVVPRHPTASGAVIGDFVIEKEVAKGGLATVYLAHQISLDRPAALKILYQQHASDPSYIANFVSEARAAAQLNHPNIVQAYAVGEDSGFHYFAMEFIHGTSLKSLLAHSGRLVVDRALAITSEICTALDFAWTNKQLVHRDIKPDNIIVMENGQVKLADLGLAKLGKDFLQKEESDVFGTPQYISPEALVGKPADNRSDIYSLGATLYHAVTGQYPYTGNSAGELARKHVTDRLTPPNSIVTDVPKEVSGLIEIMMAKRPGERYQSAAEVLQEIDLYHADKSLKRKPRARFQDPIDLENIDQELAREYNPEQEVEKSNSEESAAVGTGKAKGTEATGVTRGAEKSADKGKTENAKKSGADAAAKQTGSGKKKSSGTRTKLKKSSKTGHKLSGGTSFKTGKKTKLKTTKTGAKPEKATEPTEEEGKKVEEEKSATGKDESQQRKTPTEEKKEGATGGKAAASQNARKKSTFKAQSTKRRTPARVPRKRKSNTGLLVAGICVVLVVAVVAIGASLFISSTRNDSESPYTESQQKALKELQMRIKQGAHYESILGKAADILKQNPEAQDYREKIRQLIAPPLEKQILQQRRNFHKKEMNAWRAEVQRIDAERQAAAEAAQRERLQQKREALRQAAEEKERKEQREYIAKMQQRQGELRRESCKLCREYRFAEAKILFREMQFSKVERFKKWGQLKRNTIDRARKAWNLVYDSGDTLKNLSFNVPGQLKAPEISRIEEMKIKLVLRETVYERGKLVGDEVKRFTRDLSKLGTKDLVRLMEAAWKNQHGADTEERDLLIGSFFLARGKNLELASERLLQAGQAGLTDRMLAELEKVREALKQSKSW
ncbi:MAG: protein kinase [Lentisphaeria bacterium]